ncbi:MAG: lysophospholipid acyltransferase family protein [Acidobacteriota bacterium]
MRRTLFAATLLGIYTVVLGTIAVVTWPIVPTGWLIQKIAILWSWLTLKACGARLVVEGQENIDPKATYVFTSNHCSTFDILALLYLQPTWRFRFIAKKSLFRIPFFGWAMWLGGFIGIDRSNKKKAMETTQAALRRIQKGTSVVIYPEGTRSYDGKMLPFKTGGFLMAIRAGVPVIPVTMVNSHYLQPKRRFLCRPGTFRMIFDTPIPTKDLQERDRGMLSAKVRDVIASNLIAAGQMTPDDLQNVISQTASHAAHG